MNETSNSYHKVIFHRKVTLATPDGNIREVEFVRDGYKWIREPIERESGKAIRFEDHPFGDTVDYVEEIVTDNLKNETGPMYSVVLQSMRFDNLVKFEERVDYLLSHRWVMILGRTIA